MLGPVPRYYPLTDLDRLVFESLVPHNHPLRQVEGAIDFAAFRPLMAPCYSRDWGRPPAEPVLLLKLVFIQYLDRLSDHQVIEHARVNIAYREFLGLSMGSRLPHSSLLSYFRSRLGPETFRRIFEEMVGQARQLGLVRDRLRLKDATHVIADVAIPATIALVANMRERLLTAAAAFEPERVAGERLQAEVIRAAQEGVPPEQRLQMRVTHLQEILAWSEELLAQTERLAVDPSAAAALTEEVQLARKIVADREHPEAGDRLVSLADPDARFGFHHVSYCGYSVDILMDADSELITAVNVLPANGDEAADAAVLVRQEEAAHGNDVEALSADGALFQGEKLRELTDPKGLDLEVFVPPPRPRPTKYFTPDDFRLDEATGTLHCPAGKSTTHSYPNRRDTGREYRFSHSDCGACPLQGRCMSRLPKQGGRTVNKGEYVAEYAAVRAKAQTEEYAQVRKEHRKVERKLGEVARHHGGRRARCRGQPKVWIQELMAAAAVNLRRMVQLLCARTAGLVPA